MEKRFFVFLWMFLISFSLAYAAEWDEFDDNNPGGGLEDDSSEDLEIVAESNSNEADDYSNEAYESHYNLNFYYALGAAIIAVGIVLFFAYALLKKPRDRWKS